MLGGYRAPRIVAVETSPPYDLCVYPFGEETLEVSRMHIESVLHRYVWCMKHNEWPSYETTGTLELPAWELKAWQNTIRK
ncbi:MAG: PD-(D/E)XK nuclease-like domain-containing protein [Chloroflexi bacterium]|nr:PD-(D/E)XK nuclease-like domain-containing protein [Chloroflexota bacterium]